MTKSKKVFFTEFTYLCAGILFAFGSAFAEKADLGMSMIVAPAYLLHLKISTALPFFTFGVACYAVEAVILLLTCLVTRKFKVTYLFSFVTSVLFGYMLDGACALLTLIPETSLALRIVFFALGMLFSASGVAMVYHTYFTPGAHEVFVMEVSSHFKADINKFKTCYDLSMLLVSLILTFAFYGWFNFKGIGVGTIVSAFGNGLLISMFTKLFDKFWIFKDGLKWRSFFKRA